MNGNRRTIVAVLIAVLAIGLAAATLQSPATSGGGVGGTDGSGFGEQPSGGSSGDGEADRNAGAGGGGFEPRFRVCVPALTSAEFVTGALLTLLVVTALLWRRHGGMVAVTLLVAFLPPLILLWAFLTSCGQPLEDRMPSLPSAGVQNTSSVLPGGGGGGGATTATPTSPLLLVVVLLVIVVLVVLFFRATGDDETESLEDAEPEENPLGDVAATAGAAADRIESSSNVENGVFRAWREMTDHLDVTDPQTTTPAEFAAVAREAGMDAEHVDTLTALFRDVRYGGAPADEDREQRAVRALREIESAYATRGDEE